MLQRWSLALSILGLFASSLAGRIDAQAATTVAAGQQGWQVIGKIRKARISAASLA